jgi:hypothetical protein
VRIHIFFSNNPKTKQIRVADLNSHYNTEEKLHLDHHWREGHYLSNGKIIARVLPIDQESSAECELAIRQSFPTFANFFNWCMEETKQTKVCTCDLELNKLTDIKGLKLPSGIKDIYQDERKTPMPLGLGM